MRTSYRKINKTAHAESGVSSLLRIQALESNRSWFSPEPPLTAVRPRASGFMFPGLSGFIRKVGGSKPVVGVGGVWGEGLRGALSVARERRAWGVGLVGDARRGGR